MNATTTAVQWIQPTIKSQTISANLMKMDVDFNDGLPLKNITITRVGNEFYAEEVGLYCRKFVDVEYLRWEFEYPQSLVSQLDAMPSGDVAPKTYINFEAMDNATSQYNEVTDEIKAMSPTELMVMIDKMMGTNTFNKHRGSNMTPKKKKRKKRK